MGLLLPVMLLVGVTLAEDSIERLDGSRIAVSEARAVAAAALEGARVMGAQIAIAERGRIVWSEAFGVRTLEPRRPVTRETAMWAASITKGVFGTYVMQLVERGELALDVPVERLLARPLDTYEPYREKASEMVRDARWKQITPRMLLSHTSGLKNFAFVEPDKKMHLHGKPGRAYSYSGEGLNLLQFVIEQKKQRPLEDLMREAVFEAAGMARTSMVHRRDLEENVADRFGGEGQFLAQTRRAPARAAWSLVTTAEDLARFAGALFGGRLIGDAARAEMLRVQVKIRTLHQFPQREREPRGKEAARVGLGYGLGWGLLTRTRFGPAFFKEGHGDGAQNYMICFSRREVCMILLTNSDNGEMAFRALMERILGNTETPWEWEGYTPARIEARRGR